MLSILYLSLIIIALALFKQVQMKDIVISLL